MNNRFNLYEKEIRSKILANPQEFFNDASSEWMSDVEFVVKKNSKDITYIPIPFYDNELSNQSLDELSAAGCAGSASCVGSVGSASTLATVTSTASSAGSASSLGSAGCAGSS